MSTSRPSELGTDDDGHGPAASLTVGTAGHIDHGKTALVRALTGHDTDRLAEERRRGMSIELGYAALELDGRRLSLIDVPGHERFVRTMIAGATGIDLFLLVVAADDGVMPQTREHLAVLGALGVEAGVVALTKVDLVDEERAAAVAAALAELLPAAPVVRTSARTGEGVDALRADLGQVAERVGAGRVRGPSRGLSVGQDAVQPAGRGAESAADGGVPGLVGREGEPVLHVDRVFTVAGHGTVVTGTLWSGALRRGDRVLVLPGGKEARVRSIESHDRSLEAAGPRRRVALNLAGLRREEVGRGDVVTVPGASLAPTFRLDVALDEAAGAVLDERRAQVHHGTREAPARVVDLGGGAVQLRLERPLLARRGDRVVVRRISPPDTLGGGEVIDPQPPRHRAGPAGRDAPEGRNAHEKCDAPSVTPGEAAQGTEPVPPAEPPAPPRPAPLARRVLAELEADGDRPRTPARLAEDLDAPRRAVEAAVGELVDAGVAVRFKADVIYPTATAARLGAEAAALAARDGSTSIAEARDALRLSRKYAQALLEHLDGEGVLRRDGDRHLPRRPPT